MREFLTRPKTLWMLFISTLLLTACFVLVQNHWSLALLDSVGTEIEINDILGSLSDTQKTVHKWVTLTLDVAYPLVYGGFFAGMALRYFGKFGPFLAIPSLLVILADLTEGIIQVLLLSGNTSVIGLKTVLTPIKFSLFKVCLLLAVIALLMGLYKRFKR